MEKNEKIREAKEELGKLEQDEEMQRMALRRAMALSDQATNIKAAEERGIKKGIKEGIREGEERTKKEIAKSLLEIKMSYADIAKATKLSEEEIKKLKK